MRAFLTILFLFPLLIFPQSSTFNFHSPENINKFADYLFCQGDYLRAVEEYENIPSDLRNDIVNFKIMLCFWEIGLFQASNKIFRSIPSNSPFIWFARHLYLVNKLQIAPKGLRVFHDMPFPPEVAERRQKLISISYFYDESYNFDKSFILNPFKDDADKQTVSLLYDLKTNPPYKSPVLAGILSSMVPGSGKMYVGEWSDGITALLATGLLTFLAYDNFNANHKTRAWIFTGLGAFFYAGNVYGSVASAQIFNTRINFEFEQGLKLFLEQENYFMPEYDFCN